MTRGASWVSGHKEKLMLIMMMSIKKGLRIGSCVLYAVLALILLVWDKTDKLGIMLGLLMMGMVSLFLIVVACMGLDLSK